jgi:alkylhydroperoxidase/carboxymuconolactone decarboxylase family protein YurZ/ketosteroid isomerase-like protein
MEPVQILYEYFDCIDRQDAEAAVQRFTEDARAEVMTGKFLEGRDRIGRALGRILAAYARTSHHVTNERVEYEGEKAILTTYVYAYHRLKATGGTWHLWARLVDVMVPDGDRWLIEDHRLTGVDAIPSRREIPEDWYGGHPGRDWSPIPLPGVPARDAIAVATPRAAAGMDLIRLAATEATGLAAAESALITACAAAVRGHNGLLRESLERALAEGLPKDHAWATPAIVLISRGQPVAERLAEALIEIFGDPDPGLPNDGPFDREQTLAYFQTYFDGIPPRISFLAGKSQTAFEGYTLLHRGALREGPLRPVLVELILCGINASEFQSEFVKIHADAARRAGATEDQLFGAVLSVIPVSGAAAWPGAATALMPA